VTCRECSEFLSDYLAGELGNEIRTTFEEHLRRCPNCVTYLDQFKRTIAAGRRAFDTDSREPLPPIPEELVRAILAAKRDNPGN